MLTIPLTVGYFGTDVDPKILARGTPGFSGADLQNLIKYARKSRLDPDGYTPFTVSPQSKLRKRRPEK